MTLGEYLKENDLTDVAFAERAGLTVWQINRAKNGRTIPSRGAMSKIKTATRGAVTADDFFEAA